MSVSVSYNLVGVVCSDRRSPGNVDRQRLVTRLSLALGRIRRTDWIAAERTAAPDWGRHAGFARRHAAGPNERIQLMGPAPCLRALLLSTHAQVSRYDWRNDFTPVCAEHALRRRSSCAWRIRHLSKNGDRRIGGHYRHRYKRAFLTVANGRGGSQCRKPRTRRFHELQKADGTGSGCLSGC
jgi:hypothetical protein